MPEGNAETRQWLATEWAEHFASALEAMAEEKPGVAVEPYTYTRTAEEPGAAPQSMLWWKQEFSVAPGVRCWFGAAAQSWEAIGGRVLKVAGIENEDKEGAHGTYLEILQQSISSVAQSLSGRLETEVTCGAGSEGPPDTESEGGHLARFTLNDVECQIVVVFPEAFLAATESATASRTSEPAAPATETTPALSARSVSMDLLLDVELPVSVSFGRAQLQLKDVLKLTTGSIIELNRSVSEPVEIIVNNCVIARGEVVVVEGNFGVRIRQVISRQERMRTLK